MEKERGLGAPWFLRFTFAINLLQPIQLHTNHPCEVHPVHKFRCFSSALDQFTVNPPDFNPSHSSPPNSISISVLHPLHLPPSYSTLLCSTLLYSALLYSTLLYSIPLYLTQSIPLYAAPIQFSLFFSIPPDFNPVLTSPPSPITLR